MSVSLNAVVFSTSVYGTVLLLNSYRLECPFPVLSPLQTNVEYYGHFRLLVLPAAFSRVYSFKCRRPCSTLQGTSNRPPKFRAFSYLGMSWTQTPPRLMFLTMTTHQLLPSPHMKKVGRSELYTFRGSIPSLALRPV